MRFDMTDLRLFIQVAEAGSITGGAERANIALSAASARIAGMEARLGVPLLERQRIGIALTSAGHALLNHARTIDRQFARMLGELDEFTMGLKGHVRLFTNTNAETGLLPKVLAGFLLAHPAVSINLQEHSSEAISQSLLDGSADMGILAAELPPSLLQSFSLADDRLVLITARGHRLAQLSSVSLSEALEEDFVGLSDGAALQAFLVAKAARIGQRMRTRLRMRGLDGVCRMVAQSVGAAIVPLSTAEFFQCVLDLSIVPLREVWAERRLHLCVRNIAELPPQGRKLAEYLIDQATVPGTRQE